MTENLYTRRAFLGATAGLMLAACANPSRVFDYTPVTAQVESDAVYLANRITVPEDFKVAEQEFVRAFLNPDVISKLEESMGAEGYRGDGVVFARWNHPDFLESLLNGNEYLDQHNLQVSPIVYLNGEEAIRKIGPDASYVVIGGSKNVDKEGNKTESHPEVYGLFSEGQRVEGVDNLVFQKARNNRVIAKIHPNYEGVKHPTTMHLKLKTGDIEEALTLAGKENETLAGYVLAQIPEGKWYGLSEADAKDILAYNKGLFGNVEAVFDSTSFNSVDENGLFAERDLDGLVQRILLIDKQGNRTVHEVKK